MRKEWFAHQRTEHDFFCISNYNNRQLNTINNALAVSSASRNNEFQHISFIFDAEIRIPNEAKKKQHFVFKRCVYDSNMPKTPYFRCHFLPFFVRARLFTNRCSLRRCFRAIASNCKQSQVASTHSQSPANSMSRWKNKNILIRRWPQTSSIVVRQIVTFNLRTSGNESMDFQRMYERRKERRNGQCGNRIKT